MNMVVDLTSAQGMPRSQIGGKAMALARWQSRGAQVPAGVVVTTSAYHRFLSETGLANALHMELGRKNFAQMRWEELWDAALRIRHLFLDTPFPPALEEGLAASMPEFLLATPVAVRSSAPEEDGGKESFAGLHESYVHVRGWPAIRSCIQLVWASLWSDRALLYRQELGLGVEHSVMAVLIQTLVVGQCSGVAFSRSPEHADEAVVEAVWGLNQGLVDGIVEPDRWRLDRTSGAIIEHVAPHRLHQFVPVGEELQRRQLSSHQAECAPLDKDALQQVWQLAASAEQVFGSPQDVEWTLNPQGLWALQARPITGLAGSDDDERGWYLSLRRSVDQLEDLRRCLENRLLPAMAKRTIYWQEVLGAPLSAQEITTSLSKLGREIGRWRNAYRQLCIPMAHGMRLFGQFYNDTVRPDDPFAFVSLLGDETLLSLQRNRALLEMADALRRSPELVARLKNGECLPPTHPMAKRVKDFDAEWGELLWPGEAAEKRIKALLRLVLQASEKAGCSHKSHGLDREDFMHKVPAQRRLFAARLLEIACASYRLRDDDNIYLGRLEACLKNAVAQGRKRLATESIPDLQQALAQVETLLAKGSKTQPAQVGSPAPWQKVEARQLVGQPAGPGLARGRARVIRDNGELADFQKGEILVCDAVDPVMTVVAPLATAIVERRGGMLIHGAIIAREYGLACVTGVPDATDVIQNGDRLTVDGYLGIVIRHGTEVLDPHSPGGIDHH